MGGLGDPLEELQDEHCETAEWFKDDMIPLALEYYLGVIEAEEDPYGDEEDDDDSDDGGKPGKKKGGKKGGPSEKDCK
jgi:hypothetical protein